MVDLTKTIVPRSDQLNADDLIGLPPQTITINKVLLAGGEQPIAIHYDGDGGKPYLPCKSMRRVLVCIWGSDGSKYVGRSMTLYRDPHVKFGGVEVGGIRISHLSHIDREITLALTASRTSRKPYTVKPVEMPAANPKGDRGESPANQAALPSGGDPVKHVTAKGSDPLFCWTASNGQAVSFKSIEDWQSFVIKRVRSGHNAMDLEDAFQRNGAVTQELRIAGYGESVDNVLAELKAKMENLNPIRAG